MPPCGQVAKCQQGWHTETGTFTTVGTRLQDPVRLECLCTAGGNLLSHGEHMQTSHLVITATFACFGFFFLWLKCNIGNNVTIFEYFPPTVIVPTWFSLAEDSMKAAFQDSANAFPSSQLITLKRRKSQGQQQSLNKTVLQNAAAESPMTNAHYWICLKSAYMRDSIPCLYIQLI